MRRVLSRVLIACLVILLPSLALASSSHHRARHIRHDNVYALAHRYGWGCDAVFGCYVGPIFGRAGKGASYRCFDPGYGWRPCA